MTRARHSVTDRAGRWLAVTAVVAMGCPRNDPRGPRVHRAPETVVARVDGEAITAEEIAEIARGRGVDARTALDVAVDTHVMAHEAARRALVSARDQDDVRWHARLQLLLQRDLVEGITRTALTRAAVEESMSARRVELSPGERVVVVHFVARVQRTDSATAHATARARAQAFRQQLLQAYGPRPTVEQFAALAHTLGGPDVRAESLEPFDRDGYTARGRYVTEFATHAFPLTEENPVSTVFETEFGYHVALRTGWLPAAPRPREEVLATVERDLVNHLRETAIQQEVTRLRVHGSARLSEAAVAAVDPPRVADWTPRPRTVPADAGR